MAMPKAKAKKIVVIIFFVILAILGILVLIFDPELLGIHKINQTIKMNFNDSTYTIEIPSAWEETESEDMPNATVYSSDHAMVACEFTSYSDVSTKFKEILEEQESAFTLISSSCNESYDDDEFNCKMGTGHLFYCEYDDVAMQKFIIDEGTGMLGVVYYIDTNDLTDTEKQEFVDLGEKILKSIDKK